MCVNVNVNGQYILIYVDELQFASMELFEFKHFLYLWVVLMWQCGGPLVGWVLASQTDSLLPT